MDIKVLNNGSAWAYRMKGEIAHQKRNSVSYGFWLEENKSD